jgi:putative ABC transport system permease protein
VRKNLTIVQVIWKHRKKETWISNFLKDTIMLKNYFKTALRNLARNKIYSAINIIGLALGLAVCMLIVIYVEHEYSYDGFNTNANKICYARARIKLGNDSLFMPLSYSMAPSVKQNTPAVESFLRVKQQDRNTVIQNIQSPTLKFSEDKFLFADSNFFNFFSFKLLQGSKEKVLQNPYSIVVSKQAAEKYFGKQDPVGQIIRYNNTYNFIVTGVAEKAPSNSSIQYDFVASLSSMPSITGEKDLIRNDENAFSSYFLLKEHADASKIEDGLSQLAKTKNANGAIGTRYITMPLTDMHLDADIDTSNTKYIKAFPFVAALILLFALINYINLSTARSAIRSKEIGVRKVLGANRKAIATQFFIESTVFTAIAFVLGLILCISFQPFFFNFLQMDIDKSFFYDPSILLSFSGLFVITIVLSATYPSVLLSAYKPVLVLYGKLSKQSGGISLRKFFTVFQFTISIILIVCGIVIGKQMYFIKHADTGVNRQNVVMIPFSAGAGKHYSAFQKEMRSLPAVQQLSTAVYPMYKEQDIMGARPKNSNQMILVPMLSADQNFISLLGLKWKIAPSDSLFYLKKNTVILNETAVEKLNLVNHPLNEKINGQFEVAGVLRDFNYASLQHKIDGLCLFVTMDNDTTSAWAQNSGCVFAKIDPEANIPSLIGQLENIYGKFDSEKPFEYYFMDDAFDAQYKAEDRLSKIFSAFTSFAVLIASLGLFGLATFMVLQRTKEIGIRKVLGASLQSVLTLLSKDFIKLVLIAFLIASPIAWWAMNIWLQAFSYRTNISWWIFLSAGLLAVMIALATISFQAIKAAITNPVKSLRTE